MIRARGIESKLNKYKYDNYNTKESQNSQFKSEANPDEMEDLSKYWLKLLYTFL